MTTIKTDNTQALYNALARITELEAELAKALGRVEELREALNGMVLRFYYDNDSTPELRAARHVLASIEAAEGGAL